MAKWIQPQNSQQPDLTLNDFPGVFASSSPEETLCLGMRIAQILKEGSVVAIKGPLGSGKTCFVKGIAKALGIKEEVTSATYTIVAEYEATLLNGKTARVPVYHIDAYRLGGDADFSALGGEEILFGNGISLIEWSEHIFSLIPAGTLQVTIEIQDDDKRLFRIYVEDKK